MGLFQRRKHIVPGLNTTSTADISFMLLIFFLVTTSMDVDKGLSRQLPPADHQRQEEQSDVNKDNLMTLTITPQNQLLVDDHPMEIQKLRGIVADFITRRGKQHLLSIKTDPNASYNTYFNMQNEIVAAYKSVRDQIAKREFGHGYAFCSQEQKEAIRSICPQRITESYDYHRGGQAQ
ncbi:MAG: biopolymer transporter ExbD [Prevotella sp.]|jgi:biopolymer transport protein ExbD|nr:biopolymer transporter ExbD [Prevotella sp.]MCI2079356.1 biopolymer transporter ExbD [Prevotella sp.]MCI2101213.1 biopolymer transporter ExbD [Prevotella sp.]